MTDNQNNARSWIAVIRNYNSPDPMRSMWQLINSLGPYVLLWVLMYYSLSVSYWITLGLSVLAAAFLVRIFIIFHDCGHGSFFRSARANRIVGTILGSLAFTPYDRWHKDHAIHHNTVGNLDKRGIGDVWTLTRAEYEALSRPRKIFYRIYRNPLILFGIGPFLLFVIWFRFPKKGLNRKEMWNLHLSNLIIAALWTGGMMLMGWKAFLLIQIPVIFFAASAGAWLFYVQHQFEEVIWTRNGEWDYKDVALGGSSYLAFPKLLQWFSGNIGFHHVHHLGPRIPNYKLEQCHRENTIFHAIRPLDFIRSMQTANYKLWDEQRGQLITFRQLKMNKS